MKFTKYLSTNTHKPYEHYYLDYSTLYDLIKPLNETYTENSELHFKQLLDSNMKKIFDFIDLKNTEFKRRLESQKKLKSVNSEMKIFSEYIRINLIGLKRILKKHDKHTNFKLYKQYKPILKEKIKDLEILNDLIYKSSKQMLSAYKPKNKLSNNVFVRKTDKYWVHKENVDNLKFFILQHLPVYVFSKDNNLDKWDFKTHDTQISSVYFDNVEYSLYYDRLKKLQDSEAIRIRWYGKEITKIVFIERKRHEDSWTGYLSKKLRFKIYEESVMAYIQGEDKWEEVRNLNPCDGKQEEEELRILYEEIQNTILTKRLRPMVRTCYKRIAFQLPDDATVRISLDTDLYMIRENSDYWRRKDIVYLPDGEIGSINQKKPPYYTSPANKYNTLSKQDIVKFPYAILEVKTQCHAEDKPDWINELINGPLVEHVHKFSKYIHGMAVLYKDIMNIPYWLPQMTTKILKDEFVSERGYKKFEDTELISVKEENESVSDSDKLSPVDVANKRISIPVKVEPKVFFANERTFLSWVQFAIFLGGIGTAMLGMEKSNAAFSGIVLILVSIVFSFYALYLYLWRAGMIRRKEPGPYDDMIGPPVLVCVFLLAMFMAIFYKFPLKRVI